MKRYVLIFAGIFVLLAIFFAIDHKLWLLDDRGHYDGVLLSGQFEDARAQNRSQVNVIEVAGGNWLALCIAGPGQNPQASLSQFGQKNRIRVPKVQLVRSWLYASSVPRGEIALVYVTGTYSIRSRRLPNYTGNPDFKSACALRNDAGLSWK